MTFYNIFETYKSCKLLSEINRIYLREERNLHSFHSLSAFKHDLLSFIHETFYLENGRFLIESKKKKKQKVIIKKTKSEMKIDKL